MFFVICVKSSQGYVLMTKQKSLWRDLRARGFIADMSDAQGLDEASEISLTVYAGFDATAPSFHVGHLMLFMLLNHLQRAGHKVIALIGGGTTQVGDPSDKKAERPALEKKLIQENVTKLSATFANLLKGGALQVVNNADWLENVGYLDFLKNVGRHFSVNRMLTFDFIKNRLRANLPLSFLEMGYLLLQSYDFLKLYQQYNCTVQVGGQDQWANIISGVDLIRRVEQKQAFAVTCPLLTTSSGIKMGKTAKGAIWLDAEKLSAYDFWQFWRNTADDDVGRFLKLFTFLELDEINELTRCQGQALNKAKEYLADEVTLFVRGKEGLQEARKQTKALFGKKIDAGFIHTIKSNGLLMDLLVQANLVPSKSEARRAMRAGSVRVNDVLEKDETSVSQDFLVGQKLKLSVGKKKHAFVQIQANKEAVGDSLKQ